MRRLTLNNDSAISPILREGLCLKPDRKGGPPSGEDNESIKFSSRNQAKSKGRSNVSASTLRVFAPWRDALTRLTYRASNFSTRSRRHDQSPHPRRLPG